MALPLNTHPAIVMLGIVTSNGLLVLSALGIVHRPWVEPVHVTQEERAESVVSAKEFVYEDICRQSIV